MNEVILYKYFKEKKSQVEIAKELNISKSKVSRIVSKDERYITEKENRKKKNRKKNSEFTKNYITSKRKQKALDSDYAFLQEMHNQASMELSGGRKTISNKAFRNWNTSIYRYNEKNKSYILKKGITVGMDVPKSIKWSN